MRIIKTRYGRPVTLIAHQNSLALDQICTLEKTPEGAMVIQAARLGILANDDGDNPIEDGLMSADLAMIYAGTYRVGLSS